MHTQSHSKSKKTIGSEGIKDSRYPNLGNGGYDVQHYTLDLNITDVEDASLEATTIIEAEATQNLSSFKPKVRL